MGIICTFLGILFFMNANFRLLDFTPDVLGCILIIIGTSKLALIDHRIESARKYAMYFAAVSVLKLPVSAYVFVSAKNYLLPASFMFSVLECILMTGMFVSLIGGFQYLLSRNNGSEANFKNSEGASVICFIFSIAKAVISFIPEILSLGSSNASFDYTFVATPEQDAALLKPYAELLAFVVITVFGLYVAFICAKFFIGLSRDSAFISELKNKYATYLLQNTDIVNYRRVRCTLLLLFFALLLLFNQIFDYVNVIPNTLAYIFMILATVYIIRKLGVSKLKLSLPFYIPLILLSCYNNAVQTKLLSATDIDFIFDKMMIKKVPEILKSTESFPRLIIPIIAEYVILAIIVLTICKSLDNLEFLRDKDTVSIFEILFGISISVYFISCCYVYFGQFIRTCNTYLTNRLEVYIKYDSILSLFEWINLISFILMLYLAYRYGHDILSRVKAEKEDLE